MYQNETKVSIFGNAPKWDISQQKGKLMTFDQLQFKPHPNDPSGIQATGQFPNGYGYSVVRGRYTYGGQDGKYELAVLKGDSICYDTPITSDVIGYLDSIEVTKLLQDIEALPPSQ